MEAARRGRSGAPPTTLTVEPGQGEMLAGPEWWERLNARRMGWWQRHQRLARRSATARTVALWVALAGLLVVFVLYPEFRAGLRVWLWLYGLLVAWFMVSRTKTVSWRLLTGMFGVAVWWSVIIAVISTWLSHGAGGWATSLAGYAGHHVLTALVAATVGLGVAAWRRGARLAATGSGTAWRVVAVVGPLAAWWLVVADHAGFNATVRTSSRAWVQAGNMPRLLRVTWDLLGHGFGRGWLLLFLLLAALLVDARHLRRGEPAPSAAGASPTITDHPGLVADQWAAQLSIWKEHNPAATRARAGLTVAARWATAALAAACALVAYTVRDLLVLLGGHARQPDEPRSAAIARGRLAMGELHEQRVTTIAAAAPPDTTRRRRLTRGVALLGLAGLLAAGLLLAPGLARQIGPTLTATPFGWLAGALDALGTWWDGLGLGGQIAVGLGIAALIALSGGSLGLAFGASGAATYLLDHSHALASFSRDPATATRRYLATTTPQGAIADLGEFALTFAPGNLAGAAGGRFTRQTVLRGIGPRVNLGRLTAGKSVILTDGTTMARLGQDELATFTRWGDDITWRQAGGSGASRAYQVKIYGEHEPLVSRPGQDKVWGDGLNRSYGSVGDAKFRDSASSFYDPHSLHPRMRPFARTELDRVLLRYKEVIDDPASPARTLEIMTNDPQVARVFAQRMRALGVRGYVVLNR